MASPASPADPTRPSPLERYMPRAYVRQIYCFPTTDPAAIGTLSRGLAGLARDVPYLLARVLSDGSGPGPSTTTLSTPCRKPEDIFSWSDLSDSVDYAVLRSGCFPPAAFLAVPGMIPPDTLPPYPASPAVFLARASRIRGGLVLCAAVHHAVADITGFAALLAIWASHCRDGSSRAVGFDPSWLDRGPLFSAASRHPSEPSSPAPLPRHLHIATPEETARPAGRSQAGQAPGSGHEENYRTAIFYFPRARLRALKDAANAHLASQEQEQGPDSWVSTGNVLSALLWSALLEAGEGGPGLLDTSTNTTAAGNEDTRVSTLSFPVQFRAALRPPLPREFLGAAFLVTNAQVLHRDVCLISRTGTDQEWERRPEAQTEAETPADWVDIPVLAKVALAIRRSVQEIDDGAVRAVLAYLETHNGTDPGAPLVLGPPRCEPGGSAASVVSWADQHVYELNWGDALGRIDTVRLTKMGYERDPIVLPRVPGVDGDDGGGFEVIMSYEEDAVGRLIEGPILRRLAVLRCLS